MLSGNLATALCHLNQAIKLYVPERHRSHVARFSLDPGVNSLSRSSWTLWFLGFPDQALEQSNRTLALARDLGHVHSLAIALCFAAMFRQFRREPLEVQELARSATMLSTEHRLTQWAATGQFLLGWAIAQQEASDEGIRQMRESLVEYQRIGAFLDLEWYFGVLADALTVRTNAAEGLASIEQAQHVISISDLHTPELHRIKGEALRVERRKSEAEQSFLLALDMARRQGAKSLELRAGRSLAKLWHAQGRNADARDLLTPIYGWFTEGFDTVDLKQAKLLLNELA